MRKTRVGGGGSGDDSGGQTETIADETVEVPEDGYKYWTFELNSNASLEYEFTVRSSPNIDLIVMEETGRDGLKTQNGIETSWLPD